MKNVTTVLLFACLIAAAFTSCSKTDIAPVDTTGKPIDTQNPAKNNVSPVTTPDPVIGNVHTGITLEGKWKIVRDSTYSNDGEPHTGSSYKGTADDYFQFTGDGKLYISENGAIDTANYTISNKTITVNYLVYHGTPVTNYGANGVIFQEVGLTANSVSLFNSVAGTMSVNNRTIDLKR